MIDIKNYGRKIQYYETDRMGIVHHSNYIRWMEEARIDALAQIGIPYDKIEAAGILIPVLEASCEYRISFRFGEEFSIRVLPDRFSGIKMSMKYEIYGAQDGLLHATGHTGHCFLDRSMKPVHSEKGLSGNLREAVRIYERGTGIAFIFLRRTAAVFSEISGKM